MKSLIVGMGIGQLYHSVFTSLEFDIETVDSDASKNPTYTDIDLVDGCFHVAVICTPNFTHEAIARRIAAQCQIVFIEKPGVKDAATWQKLVDDFPQTKFIMVKNNQYRETIGRFRELVQQSKTIEILWNNKNRIPNPGSWFTNKELAFGGVSRDLIPHMLSYYCTLADFKSGDRTISTAEQRHQLEHIDSTDYGTVNKDGVYNVDDFCQLCYTANGRTWKLSADWKNDTSDDLYILFDGKVNTPLGLCPEEAYKAMISAAVSNLTNPLFWKSQLEQDLWIHQQIENL